MKGHTNNPNGRPRKDEGDRKALVSFRLHPDTIKGIKEMASRWHTSQAEVIETLVGEKTKNLPKLYAHFTQKEVEKT